MLPIDSQTITARVNGVQNDIQKLQSLGSLDIDTFKNEERYENAEVHLHHALEGVFNISSHLISRVPGGAATAYKDIAEQMGKLGFVENSFVPVLVKMAGYRNRIVHFYAEITPDEYYSIIQTKLPDFEKFLEYIKSILETPNKFNLTIE